MLYLTGSWGSREARALVDHDPRFGIMDQPSIGNRRDPAWTRGLDNGQFSARITVARWWTWVVKQPRDALFAVAPDVVGNWQATLEQYDYWGPRLRGEGFRTAIALQDGLSHPDGVPWDAVDAVFSGGSTGFKVGPVAAGVVGEAQRRGKWTHMGRVNSMRRLHLAARDGYDSVDGTFLAFGPRTNVPRLVAFMDELDRGTWQRLGA